MSVEGQSKLLAGSSDRAEEMFMPGECPKQLANVESPLGFSGEGFSVFSQEKKKKKSLQLCWQKMLGLQGCVISSLEPWKQCTAGSCTTP